MQPFTVIAANTAAMELEFLRRSRSDPAVAGRLRAHVAASAAGIACFFLEASALVARGEGTARPPPEPSRLSGWRAPPTGRPPPPDASPNPNLRTPSTPFQDVRPSTPFVHCAWHVLSAVAVATTEALVEGAEDRLLAAGAGGGG